MKKIKSIRQAFSIMKERFPKSHVTARIEMKRYSTGSVETEYEVYVQDPVGTFGTGHSWDEAFVDLEANLEVS